MYKDTIHVKLLQDLNEFCSNERRKKRIILIKPGKKAPKKLNGWKVYQYGCYRNQQGLLGSDFPGK